jgi:putative peptidoglycan lipid II flippase
MQDHTTRSITRATRRFFSGTLLSRISGLARDMTMAAAFGTQPAVGAFFVAFRLANLLRRLFGEGALQSALIPRFEHLRQESSVRASYFFRDLNLCLTLFLGTLILFAMGIIQGILAFLGPSESNREILSLTQIMMPSLLFICLYGVNASLLQCQKSFFISSVAPVAFNLMWIFGTLLLWNLSPSSAMPHLAKWVVIASIAQWTLTLPKTLAILRQEGLLQLWTSLKLWSPDVRSLLRPLGLGLLGVAASQVNNALDAIFAHYAEPSGPALLWYAMRIQQLPLALFGIAISSALLPSLSRAFKAQDFLKSRHLLTFTLSRCLVLMIPMTCWLFLSGDMCVNLLYGRGDFGLSSLRGTTHCLWAYGSGLIPMTLVLILSSLFYAQDKYRIPALASLCCVVLNIALNTLFVLGLHWGAASIAWATSLSAWVNLALLSYVLSLQKDNLIDRYLWISLEKLGLALLIAIMTLYGCEWLFFGPIHFWHPWTQVTLTYPQGFWSQLTQVLQRGLAFGLPFLMMAHLLRLEEMTGLIRVERAHQN